MNRPAIEIHFKASLLIGTLLVVLGLPGWSVPPVSAQDEAEAKQRLELMRAAVGSLEIVSSGSRPKAALTFASKPLLRYSDPTRGKDAAANVLLDAGVWRLGTEGRPTALVTIEIYQASDTSRVLSFEFLSLSETSYSLKHKTEKIRWDPMGSALKLEELPDAPKPVATAPARLAQMRQLARRFGAKERLNNESIECRLMAQPLDRYQSEADKIADGAIFAFANGTNPEVGVVFESDGGRWRYGTLRLSAAELSITLDGRPVATYDRFNPRGRTDGPYHNASQKLETGK
jgi:hypothetical protein